MLKCAVSYNKRGTQVVTLHSYSRFGYTLWYSVIALGEFERFSLTYFNW